MDKKRGKITHIITNNPFLIFINKLYILSKESISYEQSNLDFQKI